MRGQNKRRTMVALEKFSMCTSPRRAFVNSCQTPLPDPRCPLSHKSIQAETMGLSFQVQRAHSKRKRLPGAGSGASPQHHQATCFHVGRGVPSQSVVKKILKVWVQNQKQNQRCRRPTPDPRTAWSMEKSRTMKKQDRTSLRTKGGRRHQGQEFQSRQNPQEHQ